MGLVTVDEFKTFFERDFPYLVEWSSEDTYSTGDEVFYTVTNLFYRSKNDNVTSTPTDTNDWDQISDSRFNYVLDSDITKAFLEADLVSNPGLFGTSDEAKTAYYYISAHFLVIDLRRSTQGLNSKPDFVTQSQSVGNVSETISIPDNISNNSVLHHYTTTSYGMKYLQLVSTRLIGRIDTVTGRTNA